MEQGRESPRRFMVSALTEEETAFIERTADEQGISVGQFLRQLVREGLEQRYAAPLTEIVAGK